MIVPLESRARPPEPRQPRRQRAGTAGCRRRTGTTAIVAALALATLAACDGRGEGVAGIADRAADAAVVPLRAPEVRIDSPDNGATVSGTVTIEGRSRERDNRLDRTEILINGEVVATRTQERWSYNWNTSGHSGSRTIEAIAYDVEGLTGSASITVTVSGGGGGGGGGGGPAVLSVAVNPHIVAGGSPSTGTVGLTDTAPAGGTTVTLSSSHPAVASVPGSATVPAGETITTFPVTTSAVAATTEVTISASAGGTTRTTTLTVTAPAGDGQLASLTINPDIVVGGQDSQGTVTLAAAVGGATQVTLSSTDPTVATVPASVTVPAGATSATFIVTTLPNTSGQGQFSVISGHAGGVTRTATITTTGAPSGPAISALNLFPATLGGGGPATGIVRFDAPLTDGVLITYTSSHPDVVQVPEGAQARVIWSSTERAFPITTSPVATTTAVTITATACCGGVGQASATLTVTTGAPPPPDVVEITRARWRPGGRGGTLEVRATSTSQTAILSVFRGSNPSPDLTLRHVGGGRYEGEQSFGGGATNPGTITVRSNLGGTDTASVD